MRRPRGFTLIELVVVLSAVALLFGVALDRLLRYQELAERAAMEQNVAVINMALTMKFASLVTAGRAEAIEADVGANPVKLLARPPENYLGELYAPDPASLERRSWYYDRQSGELVYLPKQSRSLSSASGALDRLRFRIALTEVSSEPAVARELRQPYLAAMAPFKWAIE